MTAVAERWAPCPIFPDWYAISDLGRLRRTRAEGRTRVGKILKVSRNTAGYFQYTLSVNASQVSANAHVLVATAFLGNRPVGYYANHLNGIKGDNRAVNLEWCTPKENVQHAIATGLRGRCRLCRTTGHNARTCGLVPKKLQPRRGKPPILRVSYRAGKARLPAGAIKALSQPNAAVQAMIDRHHAAKLDYQAAALVPYITAAS